MSVNFSMLVNTSMFPSAGSSKREGLPMLVAIIRSVSTWHIGISGWDIFALFHNLFHFFGFQIFGLFYGFLCAVHDVDAFGEAFEGLA